MGEPCCHPKRSPFTDARLSTKVWDFHRVDFLNTFLWGQGTGEQCRNWDIAAGLKLEEVARSALSSLQPYRCRLFEDERSSLSITLQEGKKQPSWRSDADIH